MTATLWEGLPRHPRLHPRREEGTAHSQELHLCAEFSRSAQGNGFWPLRAPGEKDLSSGTLGNGMWESPSGSLLEKGLGDVTITTNSLNKQINSGQSSARLA